jgi:Amt family ammonium transporter
MTLAAPEIDTGATAWLLASTALVLLMTPGLAFFYGGMVRAKNVLGMLMQNFTAIALVSVVWMLIAFSLAFGHGNGFIGDLRFATLSNMDQQLPDLGSAAVPTAAFAAFQMMFAVITAALITGATADRWRFSAFAIFIVVWSVIVYAPIAHWMFSPGGWAAELGALDFAGGTVVHTNAGAAALAMAIVLRRRRDWPEKAMRPHSLPLVMLGTGLLWFGWFGFNAGSALRADGVAATALINTQMAASTALLGWIVTERIRFGKTTTLGAASGVVSGLVAVTPCAGYVSPLSAAAVGLLAGVLCALLVGVKTWFNVDDSSDVVAVHLGGGLIGSLCLGLIATRTINPAGADGLFYGGGYHQLGLQAIAVAAVALYSFTATLVIGAILERVIGHRVPWRDESIGLDLAQHGEVAYSTGSEEEDAAAGVPVSPQPERYSGEPDRTGSHPRRRQPVPASSTQFTSVQGVAVVPPAGHSGMDGGRHLPAGSAPHNDFRGGRSS